MADAEALLEMGRSMHAESPSYRVEPFDDDMVREQVAAFLAPQADGRALLLIAARDGRAVGMAAVFVAQHWFGPGRYVTDRVVYVRPENRGGSTFPRLVRAIEAWARGIGVPRVAIGVSTGVHTEQTVRAYQQLGYQLEPTRVVTRTLDHVHRT